MFLNRVLHILYVSCVRDLMCVTCDNAGPYAIYIRYFRKSVVLVRNVHRVIVHGLCTVRMVGIDYRTQPTLPYATHIEYFKYPMYI
jgi:hypothetical protein